MGRFEAKSGLDATIASRIARPYITKVLDMLQDEARRRAPDTRAWVSMRDERVRPTHIETDGQVIPANLRFRVPQHPGATTFDLARHPRDPALPAHQRAGCRCDDPTMPHLLRESINKTPVSVQGTVVTGAVETRFPRAAESEFGTSEDEAAAFMRGALDSVALRLRQGHTR